MTEECKKCALTSCTDNKLTTISSIVRSSDGAKFASVRDLRVYLLKNINLMKSTGSAVDKLRAETLEDFEKKLEEMDT